MAPPAKRRRVSDSKTNGHSPDARNPISSDPLSAAGPDEKQNWQGFCEIESEPAFFNVMLKDFGVKGVKVQEVFGLDDDLLAMLPKPVYGLIFLFRYKSDDINNQEATCPDHVWFANQTADFSCATVSLLNIVNNIPDLQLGPQLEAFKEYTKDFTPALRGDAIVNFSFVKSIHNSFARKMDMLNIDLSLQNAYDDRRKPKTTPKATPKKSAKNKSKVTTDDDYTNDDAAFHFSAYVPIGGDVWKLDGLDRQPERIGRCTGSDWLSVITPVIQDRMTLYSEGQIEFGLLSLVKDPLVTLQAELAQDIKSINLIESRLSEIRNASVDSLSEENGDSRINHDSDSILGVTSDMIQEAQLLPEIEELVLNSDSQNPEHLHEVHHNLLAENARLRREALDEINTTRNDEQRAWDRRQDYGPAIHAWVRMLAQKDGLLKELIEDMRLRDGGDALN